MALLASGVCSLVSEVDIEWPTFCSVVVTDLSRAWRAP